MSVPCTFVDLSDEEERLVVAFYDATGGMAVVDPAIFGNLTLNLDIPAPLTGLAAELAGVAPENGEVPAGDDDDEALPDMSDMSWGYATFGKTKVACSVAEVDALHGLWEQYKTANDGEDSGFVHWLAGTDR